MQRSLHNDRKHLVLWLAVGVTMTVVVALWVMILPSQLSQAGQSDLSFSRWYTARSNEAKPSSQSFSQVMAEQKAQLDAMAQQQTNQIQDAKNVQKIDALRATIDAATNANANTPAANANAAPQNQNAPKK